MNRDNPNHDVHTHTSDVNAEEPQSFAEAQRRFETFTKHYQPSEEERRQMASAQSTAMVYGIVGGGAGYLGATRLSPIPRMQPRNLRLGLTWGLTTTGFLLGNAFGRVRAVQEFIRTSDSPMAQEYRKLMHYAKKFNVKTPMGSSGSDDAPVTGRNDEREAYAYAQEAHSSTNTGNADKHRWSRDDEDEANAAPIPSSSRDKHTNAAMAPPSTAAWDRLRKAPPPKQPVPVDPEEDLVDASLNARQGTAMQPRPESNRTTSWEELRNRPQSRSRQRDADGDTDAFDVPRVRSDDEVVLKDRQTLSGKRNKYGDVME